MRNHQQLSCTSAAAWRGSNTSSLGAGHASCGASARGPWAVSPIPAERLDCLRRGWWLVVGRRAYRWMFRFESLLSCTQTVKWSRPVLKYMMYQCVAFWRGPQRLLSAHPGAEWINGHLKTRAGRGMKRQRDQAYLSIPLFNGHYNQNTPTHRHAQTDTMSRLGATSFNAMTSLQISSVAVNGQGPSSDTTALRYLVVLFVLFSISYPIYALYLHPLRTYPGPKLCAITRIPYWIACLKGDQVRWMSRLHAQYGPVVRFGPDDLSYTDGQAWRDICIVPKGKKENGKEVGFHAPSANGVPNIVCQNDMAHHARLRRALAPAFSEKALKAQEPLLQKYAGLVIARSRAAAELDLSELLNFATFDIMADFAFGESLHMLEKNQYCEWVEKVFNSIRILPFIQMIEFYPLAKKIFALIEPKAIAKMRSEHFNHTVMRVNKRLNYGSEKQDLWDFVVESEALTLKEMHVNAELFMAAGTETTASLLTGTTHYLVRNPDKMKILTDEIRTTFKRSEDITLGDLASLPYLNACIREGLRIYPPVPSAIPRIVAEGGNSILGKWVPGGTRVSVHQWSTYHSPDNFKDPHKFVPERWMGDPAYKDDNRSAHQPFSVGTRNCLGINLAWHEMRLMLAKLVYEFDIESDAGSEWLDQNVYVIWERKPLICRFKDAAPRQ
ncbi:cytochrome P450 [Xylaria palmicola]|nr:cytochrome P450 [Xylaria palmicola]